MINKITVKQYRNEPSGSTLGNHTYHYGISFNGGYFYSVTTTEEGMWELRRVFREAGYTVEFVEGWK